MIQQDHLETLRVIESDRWIQFISSVACGLQLGLHIFMPGDQFESQIPGKCPHCLTPYDKYSMADKIKICQESKKEGQVKIELSKARTVAGLALTERLFVIVSECSCASNNAGPKFMDRVQIAGEILSTFLFTLKEEFRSGRRSIELSALRQMNHIVLSLFQGDEYAVKNALNLILCALIVLLDAEGAWLKIESSPEYDFIYKGEIEMANIDTMDYGIHKEPVLCSVASGHLGVVSAAANHLETVELLKLMAQECALILEIESLFSLVQKRFSHVLEAIHSSVLLFDRRGFITFANRSAQALLGSAGHNILGKSAYDIPAPWSAFLSAAQASAAKGYMEQITLGDKILWLDWQLCPLQEEGISRGWLLLADDRTDYQQWQEASRKADRFATTATMVGKLAHELRNPLTAASGLLQILSVKRDPAKVRGYADLILREMDRMTRLLNEFLLLGKPADIAPEPVELSALLDELQPLLQGEASGAGIEIVLKNESCSPVWGDPGQLTQVILNLVRNAVAATTNDKPVEVSIHETPDYTVLSVRDYGTGLSPEVKNKLFQPFFTTKERGTGLGLSVVQAIVHNHGGTISANNVEGGGTVFKIELPKIHHYQNGQINIDIVVMTRDNPLGAIEEAFRLSGFSAITVMEPSQLSSLSQHCSPRAVILDDSTYRLFDEEYIKTLWPHAQILLIDGNQHFCDSISYPIDYSRLIMKIRKLLND